MPRVTIPPTPLPSPYATGGVAITWTAGDPANGHAFSATGREILLVRNTSTTTAYSVTVLSTPDPYARTGNASRNVAATEIAAFQLFPLVGWQQPDGMIYVNVADAALQLAVLVVT